MTGPGESNVSRGTCRCRRSERDRSDPLDGDFGSPLLSEGVYIGEGLGELDEELDFRDRADICLLFGGGGSSDPISSSACSRS